MECRICKNKELKTFLSLCNSPLANNFLSKEDLDKKEEKFPLETAFCNNCKLVQLTYVVPPEIMFKNYIYVSSTSNTFRIHFIKMAE
ncbi:MAG: SAM-dependent methyltransferase, partial [Nanoarchaeota archaeon]|nr:SAM-dependent methyltransferase [Nanoarchaeota archaeon]